MTATDVKLDDDIIKTEDGLIFNPYNSLNIKITLNEVQSILSPEFKELTRIIDKAVLKGFEHPINI